jgi:hypothetical protein
MKNITLFQKSLSFALLTAGHGLCNPRFVSHRFTLPSAISIVQKN